MTGRHVRSESGWTLVEMLIVISLVVIMAGIATAGYTTAITRSKEAVLKEDLFRMRDALDQYFADRQEYPPSLDSLVSEGYLRTIPGRPLYQHEHELAVDPGRIRPEQSAVAGDLRCKERCGGTGDRRVALRRLVGFPARRPPGLRCSSVTARLAAPSSRLARRTPRQETDTSRFPQPAGFAGGFFLAAC